MITEIEKPALSGRVIFSETHPPANPTAEQAAVGKVLTYLACPYSHPSPIVREERFKFCTRAAAWLIREKGWNVFSPITHSHPLHVQGGCSGDWSFWEQFDREYISLSCRLVVLLLPGWSKSTGVSSEIKIAQAQGLEILYLDTTLDGFMFVKGDQAADVPMAQGIDGNPLDLRLNLKDIPGLKIIETNMATAVPPGMDNPKDLIGMTKPPLRLLPGPALIRLSKVMELGAKKYGPYNWRQKAVRYTVYLEAAMRHILSALDGEETDPQSKQSHAAHAGACMMIILDAQSTGHLIDDRPVPGVTAKLIEELTEEKP